MDKYPVEEVVLGRRRNVDTDAEKPKPPAKNFIRRNRDKVTSKPQEQKEGEKTVTLTQDQLNAILASVGKVASGKESALRISIGDI